MQQPDCRLPQREHVDLRQHNRVHSPYTQLARSIRTVRGRAERHRVLQDGNDGRPPSVVAERTRHSVEKAAAGLRRELSRERLDDGGVLGRQVGIWWMVWHRTGAVRREAGGGRRGRCRRDEDSAFAECGCEAEYDDGSAHLCVSYRRAGSCSSGGSRRKDTFRKSGELLEEAVKHRVAHAGIGKCGIAVVGDLLATCVLEQILEMRIPSWEEVLVEEGRVCDVNGDGDGDGGGINHARKSDADYADQTGESAVARNGGSTARE